MNLDLHASEQAEEEEEEEEEDYIDMEISSYSNLFYSPSKHTREFEFQMSSSSLEREETTSPADELFYMGKLLPLHLPPRLQMVEKLLQNSNSVFDNNKTDGTNEFFSTPLSFTPTTSITPFESCNISPSESFRASRESIPDEYSSKYSNEVKPKKSWARKKFKFIKQSTLSIKLKASKDYLKSLFIKSKCSNGDENSVLVKRECINKYIKGLKEEDPFEQTQGFDKEKVVGDGGSRHRRSFSAVLKRHSTNKFSSSSNSSGSSSSSSSSNSNGFYELRFLKRSNSAKSETEGSVQGAIAHCKQSQQLFH